ncbi:TetR family transcriptional regulator [Pseudonocardia kunmingensis]|uniref:TetR family transcriptional regulator n=1 Tax=Pseudonocardia kunmingensis TaxID=630975 RepID=A0A543DIE0_9PSEU|nr:TetR family transcriptional regulator [Pseudonocardia kunmingensis]TQM09069.1 TetR family transcriptional regulator [Pseudonocardia kunmingensis]
MSGLRERRKELTRQAVEDAALQLYRERGIHETTIDELCERAGVARRTFFRYYGSKEDVLLSRLRLDIATVEEIFRRTPDGEPVTALLTRAADAVVADPPALARFADVVLAVPALRALYLGMLAEFEDALRDLVAHRLQIPPDGERARLLAAAAVTGYRVGLEAWMSMHPRPEPGPVLRRTVAALVEPLAG